MSNAWCLSQNKRNQHHGYAAWWRACRCRKAAKPSCIAVCPSKTLAKVQAVTNAASTAHLWLSQPSRIEGKKLGPMEKIFATHPPIEERIRRLEEM